MKGLNRMNKPKFRAWGKTNKVMRIVSSIDFDHQKIFCKFAELKPFGTRNTNMTL